MRRSFKPESEKHWTRWYNAPRWQRMRAHQLAIEPLCRMCKLSGKITPATVCDHIERHFGDPEKFWFGELQSVCRPCHEGRKKYIEARGYARDVDASGWPIDPRHPANLPRAAFRHFGFGIPHHIRPSAIPVTLVCGPPAAGKSTWVDAHKRSGDTVISLDHCKVRCGGRPWDTDRRIFRRAMSLRDSMLRALATMTRGRAFVVVGAPTADEQRTWCEALGIDPENVMVLDTPAAFCIERIRSDPKRAHAVNDLVNGVQRWHHMHALPPRVVMPETTAAQAHRELAAIGGK